MEQRLTPSDSPPSYSSIAATAQPTRYLMPTAPPYPPPVAADPHASYAYEYYELQQEPFYTPQPVQQEVPSFVEHAVFACLVLWCCNSVFGLFAFILAMMASCNAESNPERAKKFGIASVQFSVVGIIVTLVIVAVVIGMYVTRRRQHDSYYCTDFVCYHGD